MRLLANLFVGFVDFQDLVRTDVFEALRGPAGPLDFHQFRLLGAPQPEVDARVIGR